MDINNLNTAEQELICDAIKLATSPEIIKVNDRFWGMDDTMTEISDEIRNGKGLEKIGCDHETWGLICDALELVIESDVLKVNNKFKNQKKYLLEMVKEIETQSGCMTHED